jgi:hypothetical protein
MPASITFFPIGNADTCRLDLADGRKVLVDYADMLDRSEPCDKCCDLPAELKSDLAAFRRDYFDVVCFSHLDLDHVKGASDFFWLEHAAAYQGPERIKIKEMWVPAAALTESNIDGDARLIRQEARYRLKEGKGIKVFSRPECLKDRLAEWGLTVEQRAECIVDAGKYVPGFSLVGPEKVQFFVHSPFASIRDERGMEERNADSIMFQATFLEGGAEVYGLFGADVNHETLSQIVQTTKWHKNEDRLLWDVLKLFHHCSYLSLSPDKGVDETTPVPDVKWLFETQGRDGCIIVSPSRPMPEKGSKEDADVQPPHRQSGNYYKRVVSPKYGDFKVTMESPNRNLPKPMKVEITARGARLALALPSAIGTATSTTARAG